MTNRIRDYCDDEPARATWRDWMNVGIGVAVVMIIVAGIAASVRIGWQLGGR